MEQIILDNVRVQLLSEDIVRVEYAKDGKFCDENTFFIPDKSAYQNTAVAYTQNEGVICFGEYELYLPVNAKGLSGMRLEKNGKRVYGYRKFKNSGELPALDKTPEAFALSDCPRILLPEGGYTADKKGEYVITENVQDIYILLCAKDARKLRKLYVELTGRPEFVRLSTLGGWNSKYYAYNEQEAKQLILDYEKHNVPLDVMVIDTDWRSCEKGWGYDINEQLFPDMKRFLNFAHEHGVEIMFNDHPEPVNKAQVFAPEEIAYREKNLQAIMNLGLDIWWYDRNWMTSLVSPTKNVRWETFGLYLFEDTTRHYWQKVANDTEIYRRPVIMGNIVNIANGCYDSIMDSASHRYSIQWTGDIFSTANDLSVEIANMIKCGNNVIPYANADCGGHIGNPDKEQFIRWMQFGTLSPVFRPHCTCTVKRWRDPWAYDTETLDIVRNYNNLRYRLLPVIYKNAYESYLTGVPVFKSLSYEYPDDKRAAKLVDEYMLGNNIIIKPVAGQNGNPVPKKNFIKPIKATYYNGTELKGEPIAHAEYKELNINLNHTSPEKGVPIYYFSTRFETEVQFDRDVELIVRSDDGVTVWIDGEKVFEDKTLHSAMYFPLKAIDGGKPHKLEMEYFQAGGEAAIGLFYCNVKKEAEEFVYLPEGKWLNVFDGKVFNGGSTHGGVYSVSEMPLFVRAGALLPLAYEAKNTKEQKWNRLVLDYYPCKGATDCGYLYEDDTQTTAYKLGQLRKSSYEAYYDGEENAYVIRLHASEGKFSGEKFFDSRDIAVKYHHAFDGEKVKKVSVNGVENAFEVNGKNSSVFPLNTAANAPDSDVIYTSFKIETDKEYEIKFYL